MATRVTFVSGTAEVKRREMPDAVEEPMMVATQGHMTGSGGNPYYSRQLEDSRQRVVEEVVVARTTYTTGDEGNPYYSKTLDARSEGGIESVTPVQPVSYVDGKCTCCPYGYHIDLDFLSVCQEGEESTLSNLKRIQRTKRKLRKSMEVMLHQQQQQQHGDSATASLAPTPPPDVVHSTEASRLVNMVQYEQSATHQVLRHIDSSVNATLAGTDPHHQPRSQRYMSSDSEDGYGYSYSPVSPVSSQAPPRTQYSALPSVSHQTASHQSRSSLQQQYQSNGEESSHMTASLSMSGRTDSMSSLSSVSTVSSEQFSQYTAHASGMLTHPHESATAQVRVRSEPRHTTSATAMTVEKLAATMARHFPQGDRVDGGESASSSSTTIGKASLGAIREAMAVSLHRMRELEEQVKAIPVLQVRLSVLKEEKRLLALQLKAKSSSTNVRSVGVGVGSVDTPLTVTTPSFSFPFTSSPRSPSTQVRTVGVGEHSVVEPYLLQPHLPTGFTITDNRVETEIRTKETIVMEGMRGERVKQPSLNTSFDTSQYMAAYHDLMESRGPQTHFTINQIQRSAPRPLTRSIGVGDGDVLDGSVQIHEKELRTVILGGSNAAVGKRNVGVEVRVPTRSVGVSYSCDDARPATRTVGVNVNYDTSGIFTSLDFKGETELRTALRGVLQRNVHSVGVTCNMQPQVTHTGVQHESFNTRTIGCGGDDCRIDVDIRTPVTQRSMGVMVKPDVSTHAVSTDREWVLERGTNTVGVEVYNKGCSTDTRRMATTASNTPRLVMGTCATQTDSQVFQFLQVIKTMGVNTTATTTTHRATNTLQALTMNKAVNTRGLDSDVTDHKTVSTQLYHAAVNTETRPRHLSLTRVECVDVAGEMMEDQGSSSTQQNLTRQEQIIQRGASQASAFLGSRSSSSGSMSPTSPGRSSESESVSRVVKETVYVSPVTSRQLWTSETVGGQGSSDVFRSSLTEGGVSGTLGMEGGGGISRSAITRTITTSSGERDRLTDLTSSGGTTGYRSAITRRVSGGGSNLDRHLDSQGDSQGASDGFSSTTITRTMTGSEGGKTDLSAETGYRRFTSQAFTSSSEDRLGHLADDTSQQRQVITRGEDEEEDEEERTITETYISTAGGGYRKVGESGHSSFLTHSLRGDGYSSGQGDALQGSSLTRTMTTRGYGADEMDSGGGGSMLQSVVTRNTGGHIGSGGRTERSVTTKTFTTTGGTSLHTGLSGTPDMHSFTGVKGNLGEGTSYLERFGFTKNSGQAAEGDQTSSSITETSVTGSAESSTGFTSAAGSAERTTGITSSSDQTYTSGVDTHISDSSRRETDRAVSDSRVEIVHGTASLQASLSQPALQVGQVTLMGGSGAQQHGFSTTTGSLQDMRSGMSSSETTVVKRSTSRHRHSDGGKLDMQGAFSGRRVGSVEDFMPDDMRRLMNIEVTGSGGKARSGGLSRADRLVTKTTKTVTTKRTSPGGKSTVSVTKTVTNPDGSVTTTSTTDQTGTLAEGTSVGSLSEGTAMGNLSSARLDLSQSGSGEDSGTQTSVHRSEGGSMKDSGCYDASTLSSEASRYQGMDLSSMGSLERRELKSIMKRSKTESTSSKKGISFADNVVGGTGSSTEEEGSESEEDSAASYDEGSYDGREGDITYQCQDDEAITQGAPGATMYDQNIRETYEISEDMQRSCQVLADYLVDSTTIQTKELNSHLAVVQGEWLRVSSHKLSSAHQVEDYLSSINEISPRLLDYIVNLVDNNGNAAIHYCVSHCNFDIVGLLLDTEVCDVKRPNKGGYTPAMLASLAHIQNDDHRHIILRLFAAGDINARAEKTGQTALMLATSQCRPDMVQLLLEAGADCNMQDFDGSTALMCACEHGHTHIAQLLLAHPDCDANLADNEDSTALSIAMEAGHKDIGVILYKHLNFSKTASPASVRRRKGSSSPTPRHSPFL